MSTNDLIGTLGQLTAAALQKELDRHDADGRLLRTLFRAARERERRAKRLAREAAEEAAAIATFERKTKTGK